MIFLSFTCNKKKDQDLVPQIKLSISGPYTTYVDSTVTISVTSVPTSKTYRYEWTMDGNVISKDSIFIYKPQQIGEHKLLLTVTTVSGQQSTAPAILEVLKSSKYKVMGYVPSYKNSNPNSIRWDALTHMFYAFVGVKTSGDLNEVSIISKLEEMEAQAHQNGVAILVSIGGGGTSDFSACILNDASRKNLIDNLIVFTRNNKLDGLDIDYEEFEGSATGATDQDIAKRTALENLFKELREKLPADKLLTAAVSPSWQNPNWGYFNCYTNTMHKYLNYVGLMIYDQTGTFVSSPYSQHSDFQAHFLPSINHWINNRHLSPEKLIAGVPFYGYKFKSTSGGVADAISYRDILSQNPNDSPEMLDHIGLIYYNGKPTIQQKSQYVKDNHYGGVMIWELTQDSDDNNKSLLSVIKTVFSEQ